ncbi:T9SS type A sorting domain-containing protein [Chryseobacterium sp. CT-SW4]|uniref:T9SS type A sorting domain-containing protein n=1 Tax=Chryseobacterium sp. SW-1 TaxID=3157343 RepID=UPI003B028999
MKTKLLSLFSLGVSILGFSQTKVYFKYDEAGNQRYRGTNISGKKAQDEIGKREVRSLEKSSETLQTSSLAIDEKEFWKQVRLYPVPVNDILTIDWTDELDELIASVSLYEHSTVHWKFQQQNLANLNKQLKINMTGYNWGVYVLQFTLKDGRKFSKNITKR